MATWPGRGHVWPPAANPLFLKGFFFNKLTITTYSMHPEKRIHDLVCRESQTSARKILIFQ